MPVNEPAGRNIIRADRTLRTVTLIGVAVVLLVAAIALVYTGSFLHDIQVLAQDAPTEAAARAGLVLKVLAMGAAVVPVTVGAYLARVAVLTWRSGEFPPPGTRVLRDTMVTTGPTSRRWALFALLVAVILLFGGIVVPWMTWNVVESLLHGGALPGGV